MAQIDATTALPQSGDNPMAADQWAYYRAHQDGKKPTLREDYVESGFYWSKASKAGGRLPVAVWRTPEGEFFCRVGAKSAARYIEPDAAASRWLYFAKNTVSRETYRIAYETGTWPNGVAAMAPLPVADGDAGSNLPADPYERLKVEIDDKIASAEAWLKAHPEAKDKTQADYATNLQRELNALNKRADALFEAEKEPLRAAAAKVDDKFRFREVVKSLGKRLHSVFSTFAAAEELRLKAEAQKKFEIERRAVEAARAEMERARAAKMRDDPIAALTDAEPEMPTLPLAPEPVRVTVGGGVGRAAGLRTDWKAVVEDYGKALEHFALHPDVRALVEKLAQSAVRSAKGAVQIPGVKVQEIRKAS